MCSHPTRSGSQPKSSGNATVARATRQETKDGAIDRVILVPNRYGLGFSLYTPDSAMLGPTSFGRVR